MKKITIKYYLQYPEKEKSSILISTTWEGQRFLCSTGITVVTKSFDSAKNKIKSSYSNAMEINFYLQEISHKITDKYYSVRSLDQPFDKDFIKEILNKDTKIVETKSTEPETIDYSDFSIIQYIDVFIDEYTRSKRLSVRSAQKYRTLKRHLSEFQKNHRQTLKLDKTDEKTIEKLALYLSENMINPSIDKYLKSLKVIINDAFIKGIIKNKIINKNISDVIKNFKINTSTIKETLTEADLKLIEDYEPTTDRLKRIKDLFLTQIYTGFRYSDLEQIRSVALDLKNKMIKIYQAKTGDYLEANLSSKLLKILNKYPNKSFRDGEGSILSNQKYNDGIKDLCREAGITYEIPVTKFKLKEKKVELVPKWQLVSSHWARSTYITISLIKGVLHEAVMQTSGHKDRKSFQRYVKISKNEALSMVHNVWE